MTDSSDLVELAESLEQQCKDNITNDDNDDDIQEPKAKQAKLDPSPVGILDPSELSQLVSVTLPSSNAGMTYVVDATAQMSSEGLVDDTHNTLGILPEAGSAEHFVVTENQGADTSAVASPVLMVGSAVDSGGEQKDGNVGVELTAQPQYVMTAQNGTGTVLQTTPLQTATPQLATLNGETVQIFQVQPGQSTAGGLQLLPTGGTKVYQLVTAPGVNTTDLCSVLSLSQTGEIQVLDNKQDVDGAIHNADGTTTFLSAPTAVVPTDQSPSQTPQVSLTSMLPLTAGGGAHMVANTLNLPHDTPTWAARLHDCQKIGKSYRGWVETEVELDLLLTLHKQQTQSFWGTRQSPCPGKPSTRLMWKSQYVPFDGVPFVNAGSRAIVMECQYGPRRKGGNALAKRLDGTASSKMEFRQTCPARIYVKKVKKYPQFAVNMSLDKKAQHLAMAKSFQMLKEAGLDSPGLERFYVELPTEAAHEYHIDQAATASINPTEPQSIITPEPPQRLDSRVAQKVRDLVAAGETRLYIIRKALRRYVEKELFDADHQPEKHDLSFFPTVNDLQNHIHRAIKDIEAGLLPVTAHTVNVEIVTSGEYKVSPSSPNTQDGSAATGWNPVGDTVSTHPETVTVTLTQSPDQDGQHVISRVETHMSDGTTQVSTTLTPETAKLLAKLHPNMFPSDLLQFQEPLEQQPSVENADTADFSSPPVTSLDTDVHDMVAMATDCQATDTSVPALGTDNSVFLETKDSDTSDLIIENGDHSEENPGSFTVVVEDSVNQYVQLDMNSSNTEVQDSTDETS